MTKDELEAENYYLRKIIEGAIEYIDSGRIHKALELLENVDYVEPKAG